VVGVTGFTSFRNMLECILNVLHKLPNMTLQHFSEELAGKFAEFAFSGHFAGNI